MKESVLRTLLVSFVVCFVCSLVVSYAAVNLRDGRVKCYIVGISYNKSHTGTGFSSYPTRVVLMTISVSARSTVCHVMIEVARSRKRLT